MIVVSEIDVLNRYYEALNRCDRRTILTLVDEQIAWPDAWDGRRVIGKKSLSAYLKRQFSAVRPIIIADAFDRLPDGRISVSTHQSIEDSHGDILMESDVRHVFTFHDGLIIRLEFVTVGP